MWWVWTIVLHGLIGGGGYWAARGALRQPAGLPTLLAAGLLGWGWAVLGVELLGALGLLAREPLLGWAAAGFAIGGGIRLIGALGRGRGRAEPTSGAGPDRTGRRWGPAATAALALVVWAATILGVQSLLLPVKVVSDGPIYHLYFAARWWKAGRLFLIAAPFGESAAPYFPANGDLWFTWLMACWGGDRLARVGQVPLLLLAGLAAVGLARRLGSSLPAAAIASAWFVTSLPLFLFSFEPNVDTIFVALYLISAYFGLCYALREEGAVALFLAGLAAGGALGTKAPGIVFVPPLMALMVLAAVVRCGSRRRRAVDAAIALLAPLPLSIYWFARNAWLTGNPLYPLHVEVFGRTWLAGWYGADVMRLSPYYIPLADWRAGLDLLLAVLDPRLVTVWLAALAGAWALGRPGSRPPSRWVWLASALAIGNVALYWLLIPYRTQQRFMLHALGLAAVPLARLFDRGRAWPLLATLLLAVHLLTPQYWPLVRSARSDRELPWDLSPVIPNAVGALLPLPLTAEDWREIALQPDSLNATAMLLGVGLGSLVVAWGWGRVIRRPAAGRWALATAASVLLAGAACAGLSPWSICPRSLLFYPPFPQYSRGWAELERLSGRQGMRVAYAGTDLPYYLLADGLRNEVRYINVDAHRDWLLHDYHRAARRAGRPTWPYPRPGWDRIRPDYRAWLANLRAERIEYLVVARANPAEGPHNIADREGFPIERRWAESHPETFTPVYGVLERDPEFRIYRLHDSQH